MTINGQFYGQFTGWVSVSDILKSEPSCTSHKPRASFQRWQVGGDLQHGKCPHAATQSYTLTKLTWLNVIIYFLLDHAPGSEMCIIVLRKSFDIVKTNVF